MPELPEVETVKRQLTPILMGKRMRNVEIHDPKLEKLPLYPYSKSTVSNVSRLGKQIIVSFTNNGPIPSVSSFHLVVHLRMTGRLLWQSHNQSGSDFQKPIPAFQYINESKPQTTLNKPPRATIRFEDGDLEFHDTRRFGTFEFVTDLHPFQPRGIDPVSKDFDFEQLREMIQNTSQTIKQFLLRQDRLVGLGNIYVCEILFRCKIHPEKVSKTLSPAEIKSIFNVTPKILNQAIAHCGTTFSDFQHTDGEQGEFQKFLTVYQKEGQPCQTCSTPIHRISQHGRSSFYCPHCQKC